MHVHDVFPGNVLGRGHDNRRPVKGRIGDQRLKSPARDRRTHHDAMKQAFVVNIVEIAGESSDLAIGVHADHALAHKAARLGYGFVHHLLLRLCDEKI